MRLALQDHHTNARMLFCLFNTSDIFPSSIGDSYIDDSNDGKQEIHGPSLSVTGCYMGPE